MEEWKTIPNFSRYEASNHGRLRSMNYKRTGKTKILKPADSGGYLKTMLLSDDGRYRSLTVHYFVALAFIGLRPYGLEVNHIDGVKHNNYISNLEYVTRSENVQHSYDNNLQKPKRGESNGSSKLTNSDVLEIRDYVSSSNKRFYGRKELANKYGISESHVKDIISKRRGVWNHI